MIKLDNVIIYITKREKGNNLKPLKLNKEQKAQKGLKMENLDYKKQNGLILIKVDYELKDVFRSNFKTAKWNGYEKCWTIKDNTRNENKLKKWIEETKDISKKLHEQKEAFDNLKLEGERLEKLREDLKKVSNKIADIENIVEQTEQMILEQKKVEELLHEKQKELNALSKQEVEKEQKRKELLQKNEELLKDIVNVDEILSKIEHMRRIQLGFDYDTKHLSHKKKKTKWTKIQESIDEIAKKLHEIGLKSDGIDRVFCTNYNRSDRTEYYNVTREDILNIKKIQED